MDRFIETDEFILLNKIFHLKSNMDRFIGVCISYNIFFTII